MILLSHDTRRKEARDGSAYLLAKPARSQSAGQLRARPGALACGHCGVQDGHLFLTPISRIIRDACRTPAYASTAELGFAGRIRYTLLGGLFPQGLSEGSSYSSIHILLLRLLGAIPVSIPRLRSVLSFNRRAALGTHTRHIASQIIPTP